MLSTDASDGECDDGSTGGTVYCSAGTDTADCGSPSGGSSCQWTNDVSRVICNAAYSHPGGDQREQPRLAHCLRASPSRTQPCFAAPCSLCRAELKIKEINLACMCEPQAVSYLTNGMMFLRAGRVRRSSGDRFVPCGDRHRGLLRHPFIRQWQ